MNHKGYQKGDDWAYHKEVSTTAWDYEKERGAGEKRKTKGRSWKAQGKSSRIARGTQKNYSTFINFYFIFYLKKIRNKSKK